jgi:hypothetical protein
MTRWYRHHLAGATVFGWSFYSQGTDEKSQTSSDPFFTAALPWFGITVPATESIFTKADLLVARLRQERVLLILDGIEPLQDPSGSLRDLALKALLQELAAHNAGLVLTTTRVRLTDVPDAVPDEPPHSRSLDLENLDPATAPATSRISACAASGEALQRVGVLRQVEAKLPKYRFARDPGAMRKQPLLPDTPYVRLNCLWVSNDASDQTVRDQRSIETRLGRAG